jgi:pimeloyl-ACP methyl ester carboxylesterase
MKATIKIISFLILSTAVYGQSSEEGEINGAPYQIIIPENWNKGLVMYAHGYEETDEYKGEDEAGEELEGSESEEDGGNEEEFHDIFTNRGYAVAFSEFRKKGVVVKEGIEDTEALRAYFEMKYGKPEISIMTGHSMGGIISIATIEKYSNEYDGAMPLCGWLAPFSLLSKRFLDMLVTFDYFFADNSGELVTGKELVSYEKIEALIAVGNEHFINTYCEHFRIKAGDLADVIYFGQITLKETAKNRGGLAIGNLQTIYDGFGFQDDEINRKIRRYAADPYTAEHFINYNTTTGKIADPVLALHTTYDELIPASNYDVYEQLINYQNSSELYQQRYVVRDGHCNFTNEEVGDTFDQLIKWISTGQKPELKYE